MSYVSNSDVLSFLHAIGADLDLMFQVLWKHVLCIEFIRLRFSIVDETSSKGVFSWIADKFYHDARRTKAIAYLRSWEGKYWITMDQNIKELTEKIENAVKAELGGEIEKFKLGGQYDKRLSVDKKSEFISRVKKIISAEQASELGAVIDLLSELGADEGNFKHYYIIIDRLDEGWVDISVRFKLIRGLVESLKAFRKIRDLKILVAARSDVLERVVQETRDLTFQREKLEDYFIQLKWSKPLLKQLIDLRITKLFKKQYTGDDIVFDDIFKNRVSASLPFDYMVERTLMRPRDIIAFVNECLNEAQGNYEVSAQTIKKAEATYSSKRLTNLEQEWQSAYPTIAKLTAFLASKRKVLLSFDEFCPQSEMDEMALLIYSEPKRHYDPLHDAAREHCENPGTRIFAKTIVSILYRVGAIGVKLDKSAPHQFAYNGHPLLRVAQTPDSDVSIRVHQMLHGVFRVSESI
ncbi:DNA repair ATPase [Bradyrhizobium sp. CCBAU 051011]|nr:DNA repair ATPase [Bradyrhizobium sp. CCBAU 051011]